MNDVLASARAIADSDQRLGVALTAIVDDWAPDPVPPTVVMSELGRRLVELSADLGCETVKAALAAAEDALLRGSDAQKDAVATGFLEALANATSRDQSCSWVMDLLGSASRDYVRAWDEFTGT